MSARLGEHTWQQHGSKETDEEWPFSDSLSETEKQIINIGIHQLLSGQKHPYLKKAAHSRFFLTNAMIL